MIISSLTGLIKDDARGDAAPPRDEACEACDADRSLDWPFRSLDFEEPLPLVMAARAGRLKCSMLARRTSGEARGLEPLRCFKTSSNEGGWLLGSLLLLLWL